MSWRTAWQYSGPAYFELAFQSIYGLRRGNTLPGETPGQLAARARRRIIQSKILVSLVLGGVTLISLAALAGSSKNFLAPNLPEALYVAAVVSLTLIIEFSFLWWTGLQLLPTYLTSGILPLFETLPVEHKTVDRLAAILLFRMFDAPALVGLILTPLAVGFALHSVLAGLAVLPGIASVIIFAMALALATGRFFVRRVQGTGGGTRRTVLRWAYLVLWAVPALALYGFLTFSGQFFSALETLATTGPAWVLSVLAFVYPLSLSALPALADGGSTVGAFPASFGGGWIAAGSIVYAVLATIVGVWLVGAPGRLVRETSRGTLPVAEVFPPLVVRSAPLAVLWKDIRTASRTPGYAFLLILPILDALALGALTFVASPSPERVFNLGVAAVATAALLATFFGPAFFAVEVMGFSYTRTLPLSQRSMMGGKVLLITFVYIVAAGLILLLTSARVFAPLTFGLFVVAELPAVVAAATLELVLVFRRAWRTGVPIVNIYTAAWYGAVITIPGVLLAAIPLVTFSLARPGGDLTAVGFMAVVAVVELALVAPFVPGLFARRVP